MPSGPQPSAPARRRNPLAGALAVTVVGGLAAAFVLTGAPAARPLAGGTTLAAADAPASHGAAEVRGGAAGSTESALGALLVPPVPLRTAPSAASRSRPRAPLHRWVRPFWGVLSSPFGMRWGHLHAGIDLAGPYGAPIVAATDGCITYAGPMSGYGEVMMIADWDGTETVYGHMSSFVRRAGCVRAGQVIARIGEAGDATGPHLHFEIRVHGTPIDPSPFLARRGVRV